MLRKSLRASSGRLLLAVSALCSLFTLGGPGADTSALAAQVKPTGVAKIIRETHNDTSPALRDSAAKLGVIAKEGATEAQADANFDGLANEDNRAPESKPDTAGDVGPNHFVEWVNATLAVYSKTGATLLGPVPGAAIWDGFGGPCDATNDGDPVVLYDNLADRWVLSQFALPNYPDPPFYQCVAISTTGDPTGTYYRYEFLISDRYYNNDARFGLWPDAYYAAFDMAAALTGAPAGSWVAAFDRAQMLVGQPATIQIIELPPSAGSVIPSDLDGTRLPPTGAPNVYASLRQNALQLFKFHVDWNNSANSTFSDATTLATQPFNYLCLGQPQCIAQPGGAMPLEGVGDRLLTRLAYRNMGDHQTLLASHAVDLNADTSVRAGLRWYELRDPAGTPTIFQQGTFSPDSINRWLGSIAMDRLGNIAMAYNVSSGSIFPSLLYTSRAANAALGTMGPAETTLIGGDGSQLPFSFSSTNPWGASTVLTVDPTDDCTFWTAGAYVTSTGVEAWRTRIGSFKLPSCTAAPPTLTPTGAPPTLTRTPTPRSTATRTATPIATPTLDACSLYSYTPSSGAAIVPGTTDIGNHCDECTTDLGLPFPFTLYDQTFSRVIASPNGSLSFLGGGSGYNNACLPYPYADYAIFAHWDDQLTNQPNTGIYTSVSGAAPNRIFNIEWRTCLYASSGCGGALNYEVRLYEAESGKFEIVYGNMSGGGSGATIGVQRGHGVSFTQYSCNSGGLASGTKLSFTLPACGQPCPITFSDVHTDDYFYSPVRYLFCRGAISGYADNTFRPFNSTTRGQLTKIVVLSRNWAIDTVGGPHFSDVTASNTFYQFIETAYNRGIIAGYGDGTFKWGNNVTRGQLSKIIVNAMGWTIDTAGGPHFSDVSRSNPFYNEIETAFKRSVISGYADGTFRPGNNATRGQIAKIVYLAVTNEN